ncbi:hypothetical protein thsps117_00330 [Pseudomonas sp. No.117]
MSSEVKQMKAAASSSMGVPDPSDNETPRARDLGVGWGWGSKSYIIDSRLSDYLEKTSVDRRCPGIRR